MENKIILNISKKENVDMIKSVFTRLCYQEIENQSNWEIQDKENGHSNDFRNEIKKEMQLIIKQLEK